MKIEDISKQIVREVISEAQIDQKLKEIAKKVEKDYEGKDLLLVGVLKGAVMVMADFCRHFSRSIEMDWMAVSSYGHGTSSSGVVRILKDLDQDIDGRNVLIVEDILDTGLTLSWLQNNLSSRGPASVEIFTLLRKPDALKIPVDAKYVGFDIPNEFVVGYGLDYAQNYRNLRSIATLHPDVYTQKS
jgi:hypoxanthine phosphoribosyltransferase